jgi:hypothetical protein
MSLSKLSTNSISGICDFLSHEDMSQLSQVNKDFREIYKREQKKKELKLKCFVKKHFPISLLTPGFLERSIPKIKCEKKNPINTMLMTCINQYQKSKNQVILVKHDRWVKCGHSYMIAYKYLSLDYKAELLYYHKSRTFDVVLAGGNNGLNAQFNEDKVRKGKMKTIFQAFDIILDNNKLDKYLRK